jgi:hypothetical protein
LLITDVNGTSVKKVKKYHLSLRFIINVNLVLRGDVLNIMDSVNKNKIVKTIVKINSITDLYNNKLNNGRDFFYSFSFFID